MLRWKVVAGALTLGFAHVYAQPILQGIVKDERGVPLVGATVTLVRSQLTAVTREGGHFSLAVKATAPQEAEVRFLGFEPQRLWLIPGEQARITLRELAVMTDAVLIRSTRADDRIPTTFSNISGEAVAKQNFGQDLPFLLNWSPSVVTTSDAGAGVGYTGLRIRGSDGTRINVTINGIPVNDSESQNVFWVNMPDLASSVQSVQIQRGVGTSTNGAAAFGASVNIQTLVRSDSAYADVVNSVGSFNTWRHTVSFGSGLLNKRFAFDGRVSKISSDGFIDRASSDLKSYYLAGGYYGRKTMVKALVFGGREITYQSWYGVPESRLRGDVNAMLETAAAEDWTAEQTQHLLASGNRTFNLYTYPNQVDNYQQDHFQLHTAHQAAPHLTLNAALHYTRGRGFYEEYRADDPYASYGLAPFQIGSEVFESTDLVRRRWLDNHFYGATGSVQYERPRLQSTWGGGWHRYVGDHFGEIMWSAMPMGVVPGYRYYFNQGEKEEANLFWKTTWQWKEKLEVFGDLQIRSIQYATAGRENRQFDFDIAAGFHFFNPKAGLLYSFNPRQQVYLSFARANREPVRDDFVDGATTRAPRPERLDNWELGWRQRSEKHTLNVNFYHMYYRDQLVLTGAINDVGAPVRTNVARSYRMGIEVEGEWRLSNAWTWNMNMALSRNKIRDFTEVLYDYGVNFDEFNEIRNTFHHTDISFSPALVAGSVVTWRPGRAWDFSLLSKYVGRQFLDNTANPNRQLDAYLVQDLRCDYTFHPRGMRAVSVGLLLNNVFNELYESNGYTYGFLLGPAYAVRQNYFYPQAGRNFMARVALRF